MPAPFVVRKTGQVFHKPGAQRIKVNIWDEFQQIAFHIADYRFISVLEQMSYSIVLPVEADGVACQ